MGKEPDFDQVERHAISQVTMTAEVHGNVKFDHQWRSLILDMNTGQRLFINLSDLLLLNLSED
jgi:hypothetical protein